MKLLAIFAAIITVAASYPVVKTWTLGELSYAVGEAEKKHEDLDSIKYYINAVNKIMYVLFTGKTEEDNNEVLANLVSPTGSKFWTMDQLKQEFDNPDLDPELKGYLQRTQQYLMINRDKVHENQAEAVVPALDISTWTVDDVSDALADPHTNPALLPYLEEAKEEIKTAMKNNEKKDHITLVTPVSLVKVKGEKPKFVGRKYS